jgi:hypothetical protein
MSYNPVTCGKNINDNLCFRAAAKPRRSPHASAARQHYSLMTNQFLADEPDN